MSECICNGCKNLKSIIDENGAAEQSECEFGFPSDICTDCEDTECELVCGHYICDDEPDKIRVLICKACGKELKQVCSSTEEGEVFCIDCYLKNI